MASLKTLTIAAALIAGATSLAIAQNGPPTPPAGNGPAASTPSSGSMSGMSGMSGKTTAHKTTKKKKTKSQ